MLEFDWLVLGAVALAVKQDGNSTCTEVVVSDSCHGNAKSGQEETGSHPIYLQLYMILTLFNYYNLGGQVSICFAEFA